MELRHLTRVGIGKNGFGAKVAITLLFAVLFAVVGPFGEYASEPFPTRLGNWSLDIFVGAAIFLACHHLLKGLFPNRLTGDLAGIVVAALVGSLPMLGFMNLTEFLVGRGVQTDARALAITYGETTIIAIMILSTFHLVDIATQPTKRNKPIDRDDKRTPNIPFLDRIPERIGRDLLCLKMEDHYVRVQTKIGTELVHMRFSDAIRELKELPGFQPHRSWWVCADAIATVKRQGNQHELVLQNGIVVPVARRRARQLRQNGWLLPNKG